VDEGLMRDIKEIKNEITRMMAADRKKRTKKIDLYMLASREPELLVDKINAKGLVRDVIMNIDRWIYKKGTQATDTYLQIWVSEDKHKLFTNNIHNRIMALFRLTTGIITLIKYSIVCDNGKIRHEAD